MYYNSKSLFVKNKGTFYIFYTFLSSFIFMLNRNTSHECDRYKGRAKSPFDKEGNRGI